MKEKEFLDLLKDELEIEENITMDTNFRQDIKKWSSLFDFTLSFLIEENFSKNISFDKLMQLKTFKEIYEFINQED